MTRNVCAALILAANPVGDPPEDDAIADQGVALMLEQLVIAIPGPGADGPGAEQPQATELAADYSVHGYQKLWLVMYQELGLEHRLDILTWSYDAKVRPQPQHLSFSCHASALLPFRLSSVASGVSAPRTYYEHCPRQCVTWQQWAYLLGLLRGSAWFGSESSMVEIRRCPISLAIRRGFTAGHLSTLSILRRLKTCGAAHTAQVFCVCMGVMMS
jgi:hypothetical protein